MQVDYQEGERLKRYLEEEQGGEVSQIDQEDSRECSAVFRLNFIILSDPKDSSFRPRLPPLSRHTLSNSLSSDEDSEEENARPQFRESAASRLRRLKAEIAELESEVSSSSNQPQASSSTFTSEVKDGKRKSVLPPKQPMDLISELNGLKDRLGNLDIDGLPIEDSYQNQNLGSSEWNDRLKRLNSSHIPQDDTDNVDGIIREDDGKAESSLGNIDKRLAVLENALGQIGEGLDTVSSVLWFQLLDSRANEVPVKLTMIE